MAFCYLDLNAEGICHLELLFLLTEFKTSSKLYRKNMIFSFKRL